MMTPDQVLHAHTHAPPPPVVGVLGYLTSQQNCAMWLSVKGPVNILCSQLCSCVVKVVRLGLYSVGVQHVILLGGVVFCVLMGDP